MGHLLHPLRRLGLGLTAAALAGVALAACGSNAIVPPKPKPAAAGQAPAVAVGADGSPVALPVGESLAYLDDGVPYVFATGLGASSGSELGEPASPDTEMVAIGADGTAVVRKGYDQLSLIQLASGKQLRSWPTESVDAALMLADGRTIVVRGYDALLVLDAKTGGSNQVGGQARESAVPEAGALVAISDDAGAIGVYDIKTRAKKLELVAAGHRPYTLEFSPDGKRLLSTDSSAIRVWSLATRRTVYIAPKDRASAVAWADNDTLVTGDDDGRLATAEVDAAPRPRPVEPLVEVPGRVHSIVRVPRSARVMVNLDGAFACLVDVATKKEVARLQKPEGAPIFVSRDGATAAVGGAHRTVYDLATLRPRNDRAGHVASVDALAERDGKLVSGGRDGAVIVWDVATKRPLARRMGLASVAAVDIGAKGEVAVATREGDVLVFDPSLETHRVRLSLGQEREHDSPSVTFSPDGKQLVASGGERAVLYDVEKATIVAAFTDSFSQVRFGPDFFIGGPSPLSVVRRRDGAVLRSDAQYGSDAFALAVVDEKYAVYAASGEYTNVIGAFGAPATSRRRESASYSLGEPLAFSPDGRVLASVASEVELLDAASGEKIREAKLLRVPGSERTLGASSLRFATTGKAAFVGYHEGVIQVIAAPPSRPARGAIAPGVERAKASPLADLSGVGRAVGPREVGVEPRIEPSRSRGLPGYAVALSTTGALAAVSIDGRLALHDLSTDKTSDGAYFMGRIEHAGARAFVGKESYSEPQRIFGLGKTTDAAKDCNQVLPLSDDTYLCADYRSVRLLGQRTATAKTKLDLTRVFAADDRGTRIAVATQPSVVLLDGNTLDTVAKIEVHAARALAFSRDGKRLAVAALGTALVADASSGKVLRLFEGHQVERVLLSPDGARLATVGQELTRVWDVDTGKVRALFELGAVDDKCAFSPDGKSLLVADGKELGVWDIP